MTIKDLRTSHRMTVAEFSRYFDIPYRTVQNWEYGARECPGYLLDLMAYKLSQDRGGDHHESEVPTLPSRVEGQ